jgi:uncharacterized RDD family membrane protein YckC
MATREELASWLGGDSPEPGSGPTRGARLGLPPTGSGSLASVARRVVALCVDWALCLLISQAFFAGQALVPVGVLAVENIMLVGTLGTTIGHRLLGLQVRVPSGAPVGIGRAALRTALLCLVIPAVVWDGDGRGMHDRAAGTVIVRR